MRLDFGTAGLPRWGDTDAGGGGLTTSASTNEEVLDAYGINEYPGGNDDDDGGDIVPAFAGAVDHPASHPVIGWTVVIIFFVVWMYIRHKDKEKTGMVADLIEHTIEVFIGFTFLKWFFGFYKIPGISDNIEAV
jgi:hypothetical protein